MQAVFNTYHLRVDWKIQWPHCKADTRYRSNEQMNWFWMTCSTEIAELILNDVPKEKPTLFFTYHVYDDKRFCSSKASLNQ